MQPTFVHPPGRPSNLRGNSGWDEAGGGALPERATLQRPDPVANALADLAASSAFPLSGLLRRSLRLPPPGSLLCWRLPPPCSLLRRRLPPSGSLLCRRLPPSGSLLCRWLPPPGSLLRWRRGRCAPTNRGSGGRPSPSTRLLASCLLATRVTERATLSSATPWPTIEPGSERESAWRSLCHRSREETRTCKPLHRWRLHHDLARALAAVGAVLCLIPSSPDLPRLFPALLLGR